MLSARRFKSIKLAFSLYILICMLNSVAPDDTTTGGTQISTTTSTVEAETVTITIHSTSILTSEDNTSGTISSTGGSTISPSLKSTLQSSSEKESTKAVPVQFSDTSAATKVSVSSAQPDYTTPSTSTLASEAMTSTNSSEMFNTSDSMHSAVSDYTTQAEVTTEATTTEKTKDIPFTGSSQDSLVSKKFIGSSQDSRVSEKPNMWSHNDAQASTESPSPKSEPKRVLTALLTVGLLLAALIIAGYFLSRRQHWSPKAKRLEEPDQNCVENGSHGGKLVSVNSLEPQDQQDKSNLNGGAQENGNSQIIITSTKNEQSTKQADTEL